MPNKVNIPCPSSFHHSFEWQINSHFFSNNFLLATVQDVEKTIRLLKSNNQPLIKKRQLMQTSLGNYRKKMQDEEKKLRVGECQIFIIIIIKHRIYAN